MFAVFGVSLPKARAKAEKTVKAAEAKKQAAATKAKKKYSELTPEAFAEAVNAELERVIGQSKPVRISPEYNVPAAAEHFCEIAKKTTVCKPAAVHQSARANQRQTWPRESGRPVCSFYPG